MRFKEFITELKAPTLPEIRRIKAELLRKGRRRAPRYQALSPETAVHQVGDLGISGPNGVSCTPYYK